MAKNATNASEPNAKIVEVRRAMGRRRRGEFLRQFSSLQNKNYNIQEYNN
jgi:hypothetical protein